MPPSSRRTPGCCSASDRSEGASMGMDQTVTFPGEPPEWPAVRDLLAARGFAVQTRMIDGELAFPDEAPRAGWRELRVGTPAGMVTPRREAGGGRRGGGGREGVGREGIPELDRRVHAIQIFKIGELVGGHVGDEIDGGPVVVFGGERRPAVGDDGAAFRAAVGAAPPEED